MGWKYPNEFYFYGAVILWNPSIRMFRVLPHHSIVAASPFFTFSLGFGFGANPYDLKVVRIVYELEGDNYTIPPDVEVYSLNTGMWTRITATGPNYHIYGSRQAFFNGAVHWIGSYNYRKKPSCIAFFDMANELFGEIMLPPELASKAPTALSVKVFNESIAVLYFTRFDSYELWVMKEYGVGESWTRLYSIELVGGMSRIVGFKRNGQLLLATSKSELVSYCPNTRVITHLGISEKKYRMTFCVDDKYVESLILLQQKS